MKNTQKCYVLNIAYAITCHNFSAGASGRNCPQASLGVIIPRSDERAMKDVPSSVASIVGTSGVDLLKKHEWTDERLSSLQQLSESLCPTVPVLDKSVIIDLTNDDTCESNPEFGSDCLGEVSSLNPADDLKPGFSPKEPVICYELKVAVDESMDVDNFLPGGGLEAISFCKETALSTEDENISVPVVPCDEHKPSENEIREIKNINSESVKMESTNLSCVSLTEVMSEEQIVEHLFSLRKRIEKVSSTERSFYIWVKFSYPVFHLSLMLVFSYLDQLFMHTSFNRWKCLEYLSCINGWG